MKSRQKKQFTSPPPPNPSHFSLLLHSSSFSQLLSLYGLAALILFLLSPDLSFSSALTPPSFLHLSLTHSPSAPHFPLTHFIPSPFEAPQLQDLPQNLVHPLNFLTLEQLKQAGLEAAHLPQAPWSGWYWPLNEGGLAYRYSDSKFPTGTDWNTIHQYMRQNLGKGNPSELSPAEKYDLLMGDPHFSLTQGMLQVAEDHSFQGTIDAWMGYCTGWALASVMLPRPTHSVTVLSSDGKTWIEFLPSDLKALGSLLWATGSSPAQVVGTLCEESPVKRDPVTGRPLHLPCRDTNPATFHLSLTHLLGYQHRSLIMDSDSGYQIWNQPISEYSYSTFNPLTDQAGSIESSRILLKDYRNDPFTQVRAPQTTYIIGIETHLTFTYETRPNLEKIDSPEYDELRHPVYRYQLELDAQGNIIGGEWLTRLHPDLLWAPLPLSSPTTGGDSLLNPHEKWSLDQPLPPSWIRAAQTSLTQMQPLPVIISSLFEWSTSEASPNSRR